MSKERPFEDITPVPNIKVGYFEKEEYLKIIDRQEKQIQSFGEQIIALQSRIDILEKSKKPQGGWIPVSERLPEYSGLYLISIYDLVTVANFTGKYFCDRQMDKFVDVLAWMPLPKPYKEEGAE